MTQQDTTKTPETAGVTRAPRKVTAQNQGTTDRGPFTADKIFGVALLGAISGVLLYYIYHQLGDDTKSAVKEAMVSGLKAQMRKFSES